MQLSEFIDANMGRILLEWDAFARTLPVTGEPLSQEELRDHARQMLEAIARDLEVDETPREQLQKSRGRAPGEADPDTAAAEHGTLRHSAGYSLLQLTAEFRALRATVLRLWLARERAPEDHGFTEIIRFNETIDQVLAQSVITYSARVNRTRDTFLAMLGHDLRSPLSAMAIAGDVLARPDPDPELLRGIGAQVRRSTAAMVTMVNDLLEYARTQMGGAVPLALERMDVGQVCSWALDDARAAHPECRFNWDPQGDLACTHDPARLQQVLANLLNNAAAHGEPGAPITLLGRAEPDAVLLQVRNRGSVIPADALQAIFDPLVQLARPVGDSRQASTSIGLGLFIAREITEAHGGTITAESAANGETTFSLRIPRGQLGLVAGN